MTKEIGAHNERGIDNNGKAEPERYKKELQALATMKHEGSKKLPVPS